MYLLFRDLADKLCPHKAQSSGLGMMTALTKSLMGDPIPLPSSNNPTEHVNMKHYPLFPIGATLDYYTQYRLKLIG